MTYEQIILTRRVLEQDFTHVTFIKSIENGNGAKWTVNEKMLPLEVEHTGMFEIKVSSTSSEVMLQVGLKGLSHRIASAIFFNRVYDI